MRGRAAIREQWSGFIALGGTIKLVTRHAIVVNDTVLLGNDWHFVGAGMDSSSRTSEVARRQPDGDLVVRDRTDKSRAGNSSRIF